MRVHMHAARNTHLRFLKLKGDKWERAGQVHGAWCGGVGRQHRVDDALSAFLSPGYQQWAAATAGVQRPQSAVAAQVDA
jgi:hypothetical protein